MRSYSQSFALYFTQESFPSIMRRSLCIEFKSTFVEHSMLERMRASGKDPSRYGYFLRDPMLEDFLRSPGAVWCAYRNLLGFLKRHSEQDCRDIIEGYVEGGKDGGLTRALIRQACGLPVDDSPPGSGVDNPMPLPLPDLPDSQEFAQQEKEIPAERAVGSRRRDLMSEHMTLVQSFLKEGTDYINQPSAARICRRIWASIKNSDARQALFEELLSCGRLWVGVGKLRLPVFL